MRVSTNRGQYEKLISMIGDRPHIAQGVFKKDKGEIISFWDEVTVELNKLGPPTKDALNWKKVWMDYKCYIKRKLTINSSEEAAEDKTKMRKFNDLEEIVIRIADIQATNKKDQWSYKGISEEQKSTMLEFMMWHSDLAKGVTKDSASDDELWKDLSKQLNNHGPPVKDGYGWRKIWIDWEWSVRKKLSSNKSKSSTIKSRLLSKNEEVLANICDLQERDSGDDNDNDNDTSNTSLTSLEGWGEEEESQLFSEEEIDMASTSRATNSQKRKRDSSPLEEIIEEYDNKSSHVEMLEDISFIEQVILDDPIAEQSKAQDGSVSRLCVAFEEHNNELKRHNLKMEQLMERKLDIAERRLKIDELRLKTFLHSGKP